MQIRSLLVQTPITMLISVFVIIAHVAGEFSSPLTIDFRSISFADSYRRTTFCGIWRCSQRWEPLLK